MPFEFTVSSDDAGTRLDRCVTAQLNLLSRSSVQRLIADGAVQVNGVPQRASYPLSEGDFISVDVPEVAAPAAVSPSYPLVVLQEDDDLMVVNKPAGLVVHGAPGHRGETLVDALLAHRPSLATAEMDPARPGIVHRLDRDTSGLLAVACTAAALADLQRQFRRREVTKQYLALVYGAPRPDRGAVEAPIARNPVRRARMAISPDGRFARTEYEVLEQYRGAALLTVNLITGRTHQIRVHMAAIGHPVVGDRVYGHSRDSLRAPRQMLHARRLSLNHPRTGERLTFEADPPEDMQALLERLRALPR